jgi:hypothetical protein
MSYEDIVEAQAKRNAKEAAVVRGKRGRKHKSSASVPAEAERTRKGEAEIAAAEMKAMGLGESLLCLAVLIIDVLILVGMLRRWEFGVPIG